MSYIANTPQQQKEMLKVCGAQSIDELFVDIPDQLRPRSFDIAPEIGPRTLETIARRVGET